MIEVDYKESLLKSRIVFKESLFAKFGWIFFILTLVAAIIFYMFIIIIEFNKHEFTTNNLSVTILVVSMILGVLFWVAKNLLTMTKTQSFTGLDSKLNRQLANEILSKMEVQIVVNREDYLIGLVANTIANWGHQITILYEDDVIHINSITFDRFGGRSPFNIWSDGMNVNSFSRKFNEEIKNYTTSQSS